METLLTLLWLAGAVCFAQQNSSPDMKGMNMPGHDMSKMNGHDMSQMAAPDSGEDAEASSHAMHSMEGHHMEMGAHMKMTALRTPQPGDAGKARQVAETARGVMEKYKDYHVALTEYPTSLLYEKNGDDYRLAGVMYTAPKGFTEDDLNQRIPLSIAQWHEHVNFCAAPQGRKQEMLGPSPKFGLKGSITTQAECDANGGVFHPVIFNWMVHLYPLEKDAAQIWSVDRQHAD
jgi:hypothetical protein